MIETKEQYELFKTAHPISREVVETIEALREVARVAENALTYDSARGIWTLSDDYAQDMQEAYARISDWLTDG